MLDSSLKRQNLNNIELPLVCPLERLHLFVDNFLNPVRFHWLLLAYGLTFANGIIEGILTATRNKGEPSKLEACVADLI